MERTVAFDNIQTYGADGRPDQFINRGVMGNTEWATQHVVVDIPGALNRSPRNLEFDLEAQPGAPPSH